MSHSGNDELLRRMEISERKRSHWQRLLSQGSTEEDPFVWTIADIITLLLIFFILLYANAGSQAKPLPDTPAHAAQPAAMADPHPRLKQEVERFMEQSAGEGFSVRWDRSQPVFVLGENITFPEGQADLREGFQPSLQRIAAFITAHQGYQILVSGHTDNAPIKTGTYPSNWELSAARAACVARFLCDAGLDPRQVTIHGYAEYRPLYENSTPENRQANRRVEIKLTWDQG